ncbi:MAG: glycerophosphodiester phosphodiesterase [Acetobacteraceae bacterium]|nr:glycerophosphodiester phosphodiesterase [Acetobacteraceae bacterium]
MANRIHVGGHRGARGLAPENTLQGFARAFALGVDSVELDVALTADGVPVVIHDPVLNPDIVRGPDGRWVAGRTRVRDITRAALHRYDVGRLRPGSAYAAQFASQTPGDGARIPALIDVLALARPVGAVVDIEVKTMPDRPELTAAPARLVDAVLAAVAVSGMAGRVVLRSFDWRALHHARHVAPAVPRAYLTSPATVAAAAEWWGGCDPARHGGSVSATIAAASQLPGTIWAPAWRDLTAALVGEAQALGLAVMPWTVNLPQDMARLLRWGVEGICTDYPDRLNQVIGTG